MDRIRWRLVSVAAGVAVIASLVGRVDVSAAPVTFSAQADARVVSASPNTNYGSSTRLVADTSPLTESFLRFNVVVGSAVSRARLRLYVLDGSRNGPEVYRTGDAWSEATLTWNNRPARVGGLVADMAAVSSRRYVEWDVSSVMTGSGTYSFVVAGDSSDGTDFNSRQASTNRPQLVVETAEATTTTSISTTTSSSTSTSSTSTSSTTTTTTTAPPSDAPILVGAGDIASSNGRQALTSALLAQFPAATVFTAGDNAYNDGSLADYTTKYDPSWGQHKNRTRPAPGNHEYRTAGAAGYFAYFGASAGEVGEGYYSYDLPNNWHIVVLNSEIAHGSGSAQEQWLRADLAANATKNIGAIWHRPRFTSSSSHGPDLSFDPFWRALYDYRAEWVVNGHNHVYERFAPQTPAGVADPDGVREFVVGTGGAGLYGFGTAQPNSEVRDSATLGVIVLTLLPDSYAWAFLPVIGETFTDVGSTPVSD